MIAIGLLCSLISHGVKWDLFPGVCLCLWCFRRADRDNSIYGALGVSLNDRIVTNLKRERLRERGNDEERGYTNGHFGVLWFRPAIIKQVHDWRTSSSLSHPRSFFIHQLES